MLSLTTIGVKRTETPVSTEFAGRPAVLMSKAAPSTATEAIARRVRRSNTPARRIAELGALGRQGT